MNEPLATQLDAPAAEICAQYDVSEDARALLDDACTVEEFIGRLIEREQYDDALRFVPRALPRRVAIWWGCLCLWETHRPEPAPLQDAALGATVRWVLEPNEEKRREAARRGKRAGANTPAGLLAHAAFWSEGSMSLPDLPEVAPDADLSPNAVATAARMAIQLQPAAKQMELKRQFLKFAIDAMRQEHLWLEPELAEQS